MSETPRPPYPGSYWVVPGTLLAGPFPGNTSDEPDSARLGAILDAGIRSVISLVEEDEEVSSLETGHHYLPYADELEALAETRGFVVEIANHAIEVDSAPSDQEMEFLLDAIDAEIDGRNSPTLVHCSDGLGRTGLVVGCYLARHGIANGKAALEKIKELREADPNLAEHKSPANMVQERFVIRWKEGA